MEAEPLSGARLGMGSSAERASFWDPLPRMSRQTERTSRWVCGAMVARLTSIVVRYQKVAVSSTVTLILFVDFFLVSTPMLTEVFVHTTSQTPPISSDLRVLPQTPRHLVSDPYVSKTMPLCGSKRSCCNALGVLLSTPRSVQSSRPPIRIPKSAAPSLLCF